MHLPLRPAPLTPLQTRIVIAVSLVAAASRLLATARSMFDWDEGNFALAVREYDVALHQPHPPGYPLFIAAAKVFHLLGAGEFRSLQYVILAGACLILPALFFLAREIGFDFTTAICGATIYAFLPNVWVYGGTGFSDVPANTAVFVACALLLRGRTDGRTYVLGAFVLGIAAGFRLPNLLIGAVPAILATVHQLRARAWRSVIAGVVIGMGIVGASYGGAALASTSATDYISAVRIQSDYVKGVDSWRNPDRPPLHHLAKPFFLWPVDERKSMGVLAILAVSALAVAVWRRRLAVFLTVAMFGPLAITSWTNLDLHIPSRYAISYMAMHALLAAEGLRLIARRSAVQASMAAGFVIYLVIWTWPALQVQRTMTSPPVAALEWLDEHAPTSEVIYVHGGIRPQARFFLPDRHVVFFDETHSISRLGGVVWFVDLAERPGFRTFSIPRNALSKIVRNRNFEVSAGTTEELVGFGRGWYAQESDGTIMWRWMAGESIASLPPRRESSRLSVRFHVPLDVLRRPPEIAIHVNDILIERFVGATYSVEKTWIVEPHHDGRTELRIVTSEVMVPSQVGDSIDNRELGLRIDSLTWERVP